MASSDRLTQVLLEQYNEGYGTGQDLGPPDAFKSGYDPDSEMQSEEVISDAARGLNQVLSKIRASPQATKGRPAIDQIGDLLGRLIYNLGSIHGQHGT